MTAAHTLDERRQQQAQDRRIWLTLTAHIGEIVAACRRAPGGAAGRHVVARIGARGEWHGVHTPIIRDGISRVTIPTGGAAIYVTADPEATAHSVVTELRTRPSALSTAERTTP